MFAQNNSCPLRVLGFNIVIFLVIERRKDVLTARDEKEWERMAANKALTREGVVAGAVADAVAKKKPLNLEDELKVTTDAPFSIDRLLLYNILT